MYIYVHIYIYVYIYIYIYIYTQVAKLIKLAIAMNHFLVGTMIQKSQENCKPCMVLETPHTESLNVGLGTLLQFVIQGTVKAEIVV